MSMVWIAWIGGAVVALALAAFATVWLRLRRENARQLESWRAIARPLGHEVEVVRGAVQIRGEVAGRPFELDHRNAITYGLDAENGLRIRVEDEAARLAVTAHGFPGIETFGALQPPTGDATFDADLRVHANPEARPVLARLAQPEAHDLLVAHRFEMHVYQRGGEVLVRVSYELTGPRLEAALRLVELVWPAIPERERSDGH